VGRGGTASKGGALKVGQSERLGVRILEIQEPIVDINNISEFRDILEERVRETEGPVILDLSLTNYIGSVGLGMVSLISIMLQKESRGFAVVLKTDEIRRLFDISGLHKVMMVEEDLDHAVESLQKAAAEA
jgi:anti-anti-sigma factor